MILNDAVAHFYSYLLTEQRVARNTFDAYKHDMERFVTFVSHQNGESVDAAGTLLKHFLKTLKDSGLSARTVARTISCLRTFFNYLEKRHNLENQALSLIIPKLEKKLPRFLNEKEVEALLEKASEDMTEIGRRNSVMLHLLYATGMRVSELISVKITHIDFSTGLLKVSGKGGKERIVPLPQTIVSLLSLYVRELLPLFLHREGTILITDYLFPTYYDEMLKPMTRQCFWLYVKKIAKEASITSELSPHQLRHSLATHLLKNGSDLRSLQMLLGHEQLRTVQVYTHTEISHLRKIYDMKHPRS